MKICIFLMFQQRNLGWKWREMRGGGEGGKGEGRGGEGEGGEGGGGGEGKEEKAKEEEEERWLLNLIKRVKKPLERLSSVEMLEVDPFSDL